MGEGRALDLHGDWNTHTAQTTVDLSGTGGLHVGGYSTGNLAAMMHWGEHLSTRLYVNNVGNGRHVAAIIRNSFNPALFDANYLTRPRTVGLTVGYTF
jgi:hypothetical protein